MPAQRDMIYWQWLALRLKRGDPAAAQELFDAFHAPLFYYLKRMVQSDDDAADCLQETWISALGGLRRLRRPEAISSFIYQVARNHALLHLRRRKITLQLQDDEPIPAGDLADDAPFTSADAAAIRTALDHLPHSQREVLTLFFLDDLSLLDIAEVLNVPHGTVKSRLFYAKHALRTALTKKGFCHEH